MTHKELQDIKDRCSVVTPGPWRSYIEGRDHASGSDFIMTGEAGARDPKVVVEVLSPSTEAYDRTEKLQHYQQVPSLDAIVLVESRGDQVTLWRRKDGLFEAQTFGRGELVRIDVIGCSLAVEELFAAAQGA